MSIKVDKSTINPENSRELQDKIENTTTENTTTKNYSKKKLQLNHKTSETKEDYRLILIE